MSSEAASLLESEPFNRQETAKASAYIHENPGVRIQSRMLPFLKTLRAPSVVERATKLLSWLSKQTDSIGKEIRLPLSRLVIPSLVRLPNSDIVQMDKKRAADFRTFYTPVVVTWSADLKEVDFLLRDYLACEELITMKEAGASLAIVITSRGWRTLDEMPVGSGNVGFVAMWFSEEMNLVWEMSFYPAIKDAGYVPVRIDKKEHNNKIDDEIIASIRAAKFVVGDFTGQRGGVYYEAGFAQGLGKPVIWTIREDHLNDVHFDTRQFNHIPWQPCALPDFKLALQRRIEASFGHGPVASTSV
jgi:hypothetical protein